jgi:hypothetical protein
MTDSNAKSPTNEFSALVEERRRYEGWLRALDARRDVTAPHVFERVRGDYEARLRTVDEQLASHRQAIEDERTNLESRQSLLSAEEQMRRDERTELELRTHVGELTGEDAEEAFRTVDEVLAHMAGERETLVARLAELEELLTGRAPAEPLAKSDAETTSGEVDAAFDARVAPAESASEGAPLEADKALPSRISPTPGGGFDELAFLKGLVGADGTPARPQAAAANAPSANAPVAPVAQSAPPIPMPISSAPAAPPAPPAPAAPPPRPSIGVFRDEQASESLLSGIEGRGANDSDGPLAANVPANTPIAIRASGQIEHSKTLKCTECGAMNYPTEWYCERCGAVLAAL